VKDNFLNSISCFHLLSEFVTFLTNTSVLIAGREDPKMTFSPCLQSFTSLKKLMQMTITFIFKRNCLNQKFKYQIKKFVAYKNQA